MGFLIAIILGLGILAAIGYVLIYLSLLWMAAVSGTACLIAILVFHAILGDNNMEIVVILGLLSGLGGLFLSIKILQGKK